MIDKFILKNVREMFNITSNNYLKRYDLSNEWAQLNKEINIYKSNFGREPFMYDLIDMLLVKLKDNMKKKVKVVLYRKNLEWFLNIGQYLIYNTYQWIKNFHCNSNIDLGEQHLDDFIENWWSKFLDFEDKGVKLKKEKSFPKKILLELTNNCNLNCIMCGVGKKRYDPSRNLPLDLLNYLSENILIKAEIIRLNGLGESTILHNFFEYLDILSKLPAQLEIVTNLTVTKNEIWDKLIENNTNFLISCDSSSADLFEKIRRGANFTNFKTNLRYIGSNISNPLQGQIIFTLMDCNVHELSKVVNLTADMGLGGVIVNVVKTNKNDYNWMNLKYEIIIKEFQKAYQLSKSYDLILKLPDHLGKIPVNEQISNKSCHFNCINPWEEIYIRYNGDLTVCNMLNPYIYGNCQNYSFKEIWNGLNAELFRAFVNTKYRHHYCKDCYYLV